MKSVGDMMRHVVGIWPRLKVDQSLYSQLPPSSDMRFYSNSVCYSAQADSLKHAARARQKLTRHSVKLVKHVLFTIWRVQHLCQLFSFGLASDVYHWVHDVRVIDMSDCHFCYGHI